MVYTGDSKSPAFGLTGSNPVSGTNSLRVKGEKMREVLFLAAFIMTGCAEAELEDTAVEDASIEDTALTPEDVLTDPPEDTDTETEEV